jgi:aminoglycoside phosphotransferase (APT) family kinase protein
MTDQIDQPRNVREGEELDTEKLAVYLHENIPDLQGELVIQQFPGGHSNLTYMLKFGEREMVLRRPPFGKKIKSAHDMGREYRVLSHLARVYDRAPRPLAYCEDESLLGASFYVMERLKGVILRAKAPKDTELSSDLMRKLSENFVDNLLELHNVDYKAIGLGDFGRPEGYITRQVEGWTKRYQNARTDDIPAVERVAAWLHNNKPPEVGAALIHGDYKYDNLVLDPNDLTRITGVLDWEMATVGEPLMDLGTSLAYWVDPDDPQELQTLAFGLTTLPGNLNRRELTQRYAEKSGHDVGNGLYYFAYGLFKVVVIAQQIYARYKAGFSKDERFAMMIHAVRVLGQTAALAIDNGRIDRLG